MSTTQPQGNVTRSVTVPCRQGVHLRVAAVIVTMARQFRAAVQFVSGTQRVDAKSILGVLGLGALHGAPLVLTASGQDADRAVQVLGDLFESRRALCRDAFNTGGAR